MKPYRSLDLPSPLVYRLLLRLGRPFGLRWVADNWLGVVYRMGLYYDMRGPGFFWINRFTDAVKKLISIEPESISYYVPSIQTLDQYRLGMRLSLTYVFDPRPLPRQEAALLVRRLSEFRRLIVSEAAAVEIRSILSQFRAEEICRGEVFELIENHLKVDLVRRVDTDLKSGVLKPPVFVRVLEVEVPDDLRDRFPAVVHRDDVRLGMAHLESFELEDDLRQQLREEFQGEGLGAIPRLGNILSEDTLSSERTSGTSPPQTPTKSDSRILASPDDSAAKPEETPHTSKPRRRSRLRRPTDY